ncbi:hypothetical protein ACHAW6_013705 [Cyclotella cf. meneghiniana]
MTTRAQFTLTYLVVFPSNHIDIGAANALWSHIFMMSMLYCYKQGSRKDIQEKKLTSKWLMEMTTESSSRKNHWCHKRPHHSPSLHGGPKFSYAAVEWID